MSPATSGSYSKGIRQAIPYARYFQEENYV